MENYPEKSTKLENSMLLVSNKQLTKIENNRINKLRKGSSTRHVLENICFESR